MNKGIDKKKYKKAIDYAFALHSNQHRKGKVQLFLILLILYLSATM